MLLATTTIEDFDRFNDVFSTKGADKRKQHGSKGALVFRDPNEGDRVWVILDWDLDGWQKFASDPEVPGIMQEAGHKGRPQVAELGSRASGGLLGRPVELLLEDSASDDAQATASAAKLVQEDRVDVLMGGIFSSTRQAIKGPAVVEGGTLYIYPEQYEGQEYHPLLFCTGAVPAQQVEPLIPWVMQHTGARTFYLPSAEYIWPHVMNRKVHEVASANGGEIVGEEYFPIDHAEWGETVERITASGADVVFNTTVPPGCFPFFEALSESGYIERGGRIITTYFEENLAATLPAAHIEGLYACMDYYQTLSDPFSTELLGRYNARFPDGSISPAEVDARACTAASSSGRPPSRKPARSTRRRSSRRSTMRRSTTDRAGRPRWCPASTTCG